MIVLITGPRSWTDKSAIYAALSAIPDIELLVHGAARGADTIAASWADDNHVPTRAFPVSDAAWQQDGDMAGTNRSTTMVEWLKMQRDLFDKECLVVAFVPGGSGTVDCVSKSQAAKFPIHYFQGH